MFKKERDIEQDFKLYDADKCAKKSRLLDTIIQILTILLLASLLGIVILYGYKYLKQDTKADTVKADLKIQPKKAISVISVSKPITTEQNRTQKVYTQKEMQAIVSSLLKEFEQKRAKLKNEIKEEIKKEEKIKRDNSLKTDEKVLNDEKSLVKSLEKVGADQIEEIKKEIPSNIVKTKRAQTIPANQIDQSGDHYNKVIVKPSTNTYDDLAKLSNQISSVVQDMKKAKVNRNEYEEIINEEINTRVNEMRIIIVQEGDTLSKIAKRAYGDYKAYDKILEANPELIDDPDRIYVGQRLRVPLGE